MITPPIAGLIVAFWLFVLIDFLLFKFYLPFDPEDATFWGLFRESFYVVLLVAGVVLVIPFQIFIATKVFERYENNKKILNLSLPMLIILTSLIFAGLVTLKFRERHETNEFLMLRMAAASIITLSYWAVNYSVYKLIKNPPQD